MNIEVAPSMTNTNALGSPGHRQLQNSFCHDYDKASLINAFKLDNKSNNGFTLCVKHTDDVIDDRKMKQMFASYDSVSNIKIITGLSNYGLIWFKSEDQAKKAISEMNGYVINNKPLSIFFLHDDVELSC